MTLIAAWITDEFRIVASDSKLLDINNNLINGDHQKVFANKLFSLSLYGSSLASERKFINNSLNKNRNAEINDFKEDLKIELYKSKTRTAVFKLVAIPQKGNPEIWSHRFGEKLICYKMDDYKRIHHPNLPSHLFFSEQSFDDNKVDTEHQKALLSHFNKLKSIPPEDLRISCEEPAEVQILMRLIIDATNEVNKAIHKSNIGGNKVFYAYSFNNQNWKHDVYPKNHIPKEMEDFMKDLNETLTN